MSLSHDEKPWFWNIFNLTGLQLCRHLITDASARHIPEPIFEGASLDVGEEWITNGSENFIWLPRNDHQSCGNPTFGPGLGQALPSLSPMMFTQSCDFLRNNYYGLVSMVGFLIVSDGQRFTTHSRNFLTESSCSQNRAARDFPMSKRRYSNTIKALHCTQNATQLVAWKSFML